MSESSIKPAIITKVTPDSIGAEIGFEPGDSIVAVNGQKPRDLIDYQFLCADEFLELEVLDAKGKTHKLEIEKEYGNIPLVECYPGKLNQVFLNILSNAIYAINKKFGDQEGGVLRITTSNNETKVYVKTEDNGIGMDEVTRKKIFEPFFTTKDVGEGTGLGMSIAYNTIRRHQGEIQINSTPGEGSEFIMELPIVLEIMEDDV